MKSIKFVFVLLIMICMPKIAAFGQSVDDNVEGCNSGNAKLCLSAATRYSLGTGVPVDHRRGLEYFRKACDLGNADGCSSTGESYVIGRGVAKDATKAAAYLEMACNHGFARGCKNLAILYDDGDGVTKDFSRAVVLLDRACDLGDAGGCYGLAMHYSKGEGVKRDISRADSLFAKACHAPVAQPKLATLCGRRAEQRSSEQSASIENRASSLGLIFQQKALAQATPTYKKMLDAAMTRLIKKDQNCFRVYDVGFGNNSHKAMQACDKFSNLYIQPMSVSAADQANGVISRSTMRATYIRQGVNDQWEDVRLCYRMALVKNFGWVVAGYC